MIIQLCLAHNTMQYYKGPLSSMIAVWRDTIAHPVTHKDKTTRQIGSMNHGHTYRIKKTPG